MSDDRVTFRIGGDEFVVGPLVLYSLERAEEHIHALSQATSTTKLARHAVEILAASLAANDGKQPTGDDLAKRLLPSEQVGLFESLVKLLQISGFVAPGEALATAAQPSGGGSSPSL